MGTVHAEDTEFTQRHNRARSELKPALYANNAPEFGVADPLAHG